MGQFIFTKTPLEGLTVIEPKVFADERGYFFEGYNKADFENNGIFADFVQDNESRSVKGVLRGLHFQKEHPQGKLISVTKGAVFDVAVDIRSTSPTFGLWFALELSSENKKRLFIPAGFAHGFLALSEHVVFSYKCTDYYYPKDQDGIIWNDKDIGINWPIDGMDLILSEKDKKNQSFAEFAGKANTI